MIAYYPPSPPCIDCLDEGKKVASVGEGLCDFHTGKKLAREAIAEAVKKVLHPAPQRKKGK